MKLLITAFEPFNGGTVNPSQLVLEQLKATAGMELADMVKGLQAVVNYFS